MPGYKKKQPTRTLKRLYSIFGVQFPEDMPKLERVENIEINSHTQAEMRYLPGFGLDDSGMSSPSTGELSTYLQQVAQTNNDWIQQSDAIRILTPEIDRASEIMVSSILSPTDMQTDTINIICEDTDMGEEIESKVGEELTAFFNDTIDLGNRAYNYIKEALYGAGSSPILILPQSNIRTLNTALDADMMKAGRLRVKRSGKIEYDANPLSIGKVYGSNEVFGSYEAWITDVDTASGKQKLEKIENNILAELEESLEKFNPFTNIKVPEVVIKSKEATHQILKLFKDTERSIVISSDPHALHRNKDRLTSMADRLAAKVEGNFLFDAASPTFMMNMDNGLEENDNPAIIEIPSRAVVPVIVPGSPNQHIGYFILVDQWGTPLVDMSADRQSTFGPRKLTESATQAAFGAPNLYRFNSGITDQQRYDMTSIIFGITLKQLMENKLEEYGLTGTTIEEHDAITGCMFRHLIQRKKCGLVFIPEQLMVYFRFDHRPDGTGKSITESMSTMLSLRTVLLMSYIMAATENSVDNKVISVNVDEKQTNIHQFLDQVRNAYVQKKMMRFDVNPLTVQQDLIQKSLTILPKGIKGLNDSLDVQTEHRSTGSIAPDEGLMEKITDWIITWLQVPHSALNHLSENEYSRSVATTNLFFNNNVRGKQKIAAKHLTKFVKRYTSYSKYLRDLIEKILKTTGATYKASKDASAEAYRGKNKAPKSKLKIQTNDDSIRKNVEKIISCLKVSLPTPQIVVDKAQYKEIEEYLTAAEKIIETLFHDEMIADYINQSEDGNGIDLRQTMQSLRATVRAQMVRDYIDNIGFQSSFEIPFPQDLNLDHIKELMQFLANQGKGLKDWKMHVVDKAKSEDPAAQEEQNPNDNSGNTTESGDEVNWEDEGNPPSLDDESPTNEGDNNEESGEPQDNEEGTDFDNIPEPPSF